MTNGLGEWGCFIYSDYRLISKIKKLEACIAEVDYGAMEAGLSRESALEELSRLSKSLLAAPEGPVQIGVPEKILTPMSVFSSAAHYFSAFTKSSQCFPYFAPAPNVKR